MKGLPFDIPRSLNTYIKQFESDPDNGINNLKARLKKRGMDAAGFFLLAWLFHNNDQQDQAIEYALKSKCCAPGSPFLEHLHYFLVHPERFNAWNPYNYSFEEKEQESPMVQSGYALDLDLLIKQLSNAENKRITISPDSKDDRNLGEKSEKVEDIASETLALIYEKQKRYEEAIRTLEKLKQIKPHKSDTYSEEIRRIDGLRSKVASSSEKN